MDEYRREKDTQGETHGYTFGSGSTDPWKRKMRNVMLIMIGMFAVWFGFFYWALS